MGARAVVFSARNRVEFRQIDVPDPSPGDVVVRTRFSWISNGTESSFLRGERTSGDVPFHPEDPPPFPRVPGYQKTGVVEWVGSEVEDVCPGEWVFAATSRVSYGVTPMGGHVSPAVTPREQIWKLPQGLSPRAASALVLVQVGYNCGTRAPVEPGAIAVVVGDGLVGHWAAQTLAWRGARVVMIGHHDFRLGKLHVPGARTVNSNETDPLESVSRLASEGVAVLVDSVGRVPLVEAFLPLMRRDAHIVSAGFCGAEGRIDIQKLRLGEITLHCPSGWRRQRMDTTLELLAEGTLDAASLVTHSFPASQAPAAWDLIINRREEFLGVVLEWTQ